MLPKGILFDLDDTIIAYGVVAGPIWRNLCEEYAGKVGPYDAATLFEAIDDVRKWYWSDKGRHKAGRMDLKSEKKSLSRKGRYLGWSLISGLHASIDRAQNRSTPEMITLLLRWICLLIIGPGLWLGFYLGDLV